MTSEARHLLVPVFVAKHVNASLKHFEGLSESFLKGEWEDAIAKAGKFVEAALKGLYIRGTGNSPASGKHFKVEAVITALANITGGTVDDSIRLTIPRACRFIYEVASNRGGRHDPDEIDPNAMDASAVMTQCSWVLAEMIRHAQRGSASMQDAQNAVESLMKRRYQLVEEIDGHTYFHGSNPSAVDVALVILLKAYPRRISLANLVAQLRSNKFSDSNARMAVTRINRLLHRDDDGNLMLLQPGLRQAEELLSSAAVASAD